MRVYKNQSFAKFARKERISNETLCQAVKNAEAGQIDADYGGGLIKQRIARRNEGKSGGYRSVILYRRGDKAFFVHAFAKNQQANLSDKEVNALKALSKETFRLSDQQVAILVQHGVYEEVPCHG